MGLYSTPMDPDFTRRLAREIVLTRGPGARGSPRSTTTHMEGSKAGHRQTLECALRIKLN